MEPLSVFLLFAGGLIAGVINTLAGGGSLLTVPLLVLLGIPGTLANGTNRIGVLLQSLAAALQFRALGSSDLRAASRILLPLVLGSLAGAVVAASLPDRVFERIFGAAMILVLPPILVRPRLAPAHRPWPPWASFLVFLFIGLYAGALQAGVGIFLIFALSHAGYDLVRANSVKVIVITVLTAVAVPPFVLQGQVAWVPGLCLAAGSMLGGRIGARLAVHRGEPLIRPVLLVMVLALAGKMLGLY